MRYDDNRCNEYNSPIKSIDSGPGTLHKLSQYTKPFLAQVPQLLAVHFLDRFIEAAQECKSFGGDPGHYHSTIFGFAAARNQGSFFQAIQEPGDVWIAGDHAVRNLA